MAFAAGEQGRHAALLQALSVTERSRLWPEADSLSAGLSAGLPASTPHA